MPGSAYQALHRRLLELNHMAFSGSNMPSPLPSVLLDFISTLHNSFIREP
jgi:hypothetical protein